MKVLKKILIILLVLGVFLISILTFLGYQQYQSAIEEISIEEKVKEIKERDSYAAYDELSPYVIQATVAIEDHRFYSHHGIDYIGTIRAFLTNLVSKEIVGGGSTITQQLAKNMYFGYQPSLVRKIAEVFVARELEQRYSKEEILTLYVNIINYGDNHMGIKEAANGYFNVEPKNLTLDQASLLAGLPQSPANYQLSNHHEQAAARQKLVLKAMVEEDMITQAQADEILSQ